jgi:hypothetical protein
MNSSNDDGATWEGQFSLADPPVSIAASNVTTDDISTLVSYNNHVAVVWSNQGENISDTVNLALHPDSSAPTADWQYLSYTLPGGAIIDDHLSTKSIAVVDDKLFVALKLGGGADPGEPGIAVVAYDTADTPGFSFHTYSTQANHDTRPILVVDEDAEMLYVFVSGKEGGSKICYKALAITSPASDMGDFAVGDCGIEFMEDDFYKDINNATSMKGNVSALTGIVVLAADETNGQFYAHNTMGDPPPVVDVTEPARNAADAPADRRPISAIFSKQMNGATINASSFIVKNAGVPVAGAVSYDPVLKKGTFVPTLPLALETTYTVELSSAIQDSGTPGKSLNEGIESGIVRETWQFTTLAANALPTARFQVTEYTVNEGAGSATIEVSLFPASTSPVTVNFSTSDGTATAPDDYTAVTNQPIVFAANDVSETVFVTIKNDNLNELNETVNLHLSNQVPPGVPNDPGYSATLVILDNDPEPDVMFTSNAYTVKKDAGKVTLDLKLSAVSGRDVTMKYETGGGSATPGVDYEETKGTVVFAKGQTGQSIEIPILDNNLPGSDKFFNVQLIDDPLVDNGATLNTPPIQAKVTIRDQVFVYLPIVLSN